MNSSPKRQAPPDRRIAGLAARRHNVVTIGELRGVGLDDGEIKYRLRVGRLHQQHRGVYSVGTSSLTLHGRFLAAVLALGKGAVLSHRSAAALWGLRRLRGSEEEVDVSVARALKKRPGIRPRFMQSLDPADVTARDGIPVTTVARTLLDLADDVPLRQVRRATNEALVQRRITVPLLYRQLGKASGRRGATAFHSLIADAAPTRSELEDVTLEFLARHGLPRPGTNVEVAGWEVDFFFPELRLVIEADSERFHDNALARAQDARKEASLEAHGYRVVRLRWSDVTRDERRTARRLARICAAPTSRAA
jgi:hypothetical protein